MSRKAGRLALLWGAILGVAISFGSVATGQASSVSSIAPEDCTVIVSAGGSISDAITGAVSGDVICVRGGIYSEQVRVTSSRTGLTIVAYPGEFPVIDGLRQLPGGPYQALVRIEAADTLFDGFEVRQSSGRGIQVDYPARNIVIRNSTVHDNWNVGITILGETVSNAGGGEVGTNYARDVLVENNLVYQNVRKAKQAPAIHIATPTGTTADAWGFDPGLYWDTPYWNGAGTDLPAEGLDGIYLVRDAGGQAAQVYLATGSSRVAYIGAARSANGTEIAFDGRDILMFDAASGRYTVHFDGSVVDLPSGAGIDGLYIEPNESGCTGCRPLLMSFSSTTTVPGIGSVTPADLVRFTPTASPSTLGELSTGTFSVYQRASDIGMTSSNNIDAIAFAPDGRLVVSTAGSFTQGGTIVGRDEDLIAHDATTGTWTLYFDGSAVLDNPFPDDVLAATIDSDGNVYISGDPSGGAGLVFNRARDSIARNNQVYQNYGEGLVTGRKSVNITLQNNVTWDNSHANLYVTNTVNPTVDGNLVYCTDDRRFWSKGSTQYYRAGPGITMRDETIEKEGNQPGSGQIFINNIVVGCGTNLIIDSQIGSGLLNAVIANNTFAEARGDAGARVVNVLLEERATYVDSTFANNLLVQTDPAVDIVRQGGSGIVFQNITVNNNLYSRTPPASWFPAEPGRVVANPQLVNPVLPVSGVPTDPAWYKIQPGSPADNAGSPLAEVTVDFFGSARAATPDIGAHENASAPASGSIVLVVETEPSGTGVQFSIETNFAGTVQLGDGDQTTADDLPPTQYLARALDVSGWNVTGASCSDGSDPLSINLGSGETVTCTFTYTQQPQVGTIIIRKETDPDGAPQLFTFSTDYSANFQLSDGQSNTSDPLAVGIYAVEEADQAGWSQTGATCDDGSSPDAIGLSAGETVTCTFTNTQQPEPGTIIVKKETDPDGAVQVFSFSTNYGAGFELSDGQSNTSDPLAAGSYSVQEAALSGWTQTSATCDDGSSPGAIDLAAGETVTCTFVNTQQPQTGTIIVRKETTPAGAAQVFGFSTNYGAAFQLSDGQSSTSEPLVAGTYSVQEDSQTGWTQTSATCDDGSSPDAIGLTAGETVTCTFVNQQQLPPGSSEILYISDKRAGTVGGVSYTPSDILAFDVTTGAWSMFLDLSDLGINRGINGFTFLPDNSVLLTFSRNQAIAGLGTVTPKDIVRFNPTATGTADVRVRSNGILTDLMSG